MTSMPPGWYDDGRGALRWWDGLQWTEHVATPDPEPVPGAAEVEAIDEIIPFELQEGPGAEAHPAGYPGATGSGAFVAATEPATSKLWILWVVLGVVLLGVVIAVAVLIPLLFLSLPRGGGAEPVTPQGGDQVAAVAAVEQYDAAWREVDCDAFIESTTQGFRDLQRLSDCAAFEESARVFADSTEDYSIRVTSVEVEDGGIEVETVESYLSYIDDSGELVEDPVSYEDEWTYHVVEDGGRWAIDATD